MAEKSSLKFLNSMPVRLVTLALALQAVVLYAISRPEFKPTAPPLAAFTTVIERWNMLQEGYVDEDTRAVLQADDLLSRTYGRSGDQVPASLFIAAFRSQRTGKAPHSPKNCLPGAGWVQDESVTGTVKLNVPNTGEIEVNRYVVSKGGNRSVVLYWYQSRDRVVASEYRAKVFVVLDSMRYNRTDTALVRIVVPVLNGNDAGANKVAAEFAIAAFPFVRSALPL